MVRDHGSSGRAFQPDSAKPGLKIRDVLPGGPASKKMSRLYEGEVILTIDDVAVDSDMDLTRVLNGPLPRNVRLHVRDTDGKERDVTLRPINYEQAQPLLYQAWMDGNRRIVDRLSQGTFGYLHISAMDALSFSKFEEQLYAVGAGKDGLLIDVRAKRGRQHGRPPVDGADSAGPRHHGAARRRAGLSARSENLRHLEQAHCGFVQSKQLQQRQDFQSCHQDAQARPSDRRTDGRRRHQYRGPNESWTWASSACPIAAGF